VSATDQNHTMASVESAQVVAAGKKRRRARPGPALPIAERVSVVRDTLKVIPAVISDDDDVMMVGETIEYEVMAPDEDPSDDLPYVAVVQKVTHKKAQTVRKQPIRRDIPMAVLRRMVQDAMTACGVMYAWEKNAMSAMSEGVDDHVIQLLSVGAAVCDHSQRRTLSPEDLKLAVSLQSRFVPKQDDEINTVGPVDE